MNHKITFMLLLGALFFASATASAFDDKVEYPKGDKLEDGKVYVLQNVNLLGQWLGTTSWDNALYVNNFTYEEGTKLTAQKLSDGWTFYEAGSLNEANATANYLLIPTGSTNTRLTQMSTTPESSLPVYYPSLVPGNGDNPVYMFKVGPNNNEGALGCNIHMHVDNQYVVASYPGYYAYPDYYGGGLTYPDGEYVYVGEDDDHIVMADSSTCHWLLIEPANIDQYVTKASACALLRAFNRTFSAEEYAAYQTGFGASYTAAVAIYNKATLTENDVKAIEGILNGKESLYEAITEAIEALGDDTNATLSSAIAAAKTTFDTKTSAAVVSAADMTLRDATATYSKSKGIITNLGINMSFEDMSSQGGRQANGAEGAPTGWHLYLNGVECVTRSDVANQGVTTWQGIADGGQGPLKDGLMVWGVWNAYIPPYELSQTITGLANGTYTISAGMMVGANSSGSRRTTQRLFGNLNAQYFGSSDQYNESLLDMTEMHSYQGNEEPTTDELLSPMEVKAYVYDGSLTFGIRTDNNIAAALRTTYNPAGGDGWIKVDNFQIKSEGFVKDDQMEVFNHYKNLTEDILEDPQYKVYPSLQQSAEQTLNQVKDGSAADEVIDQSIASLSQLVKPLSSSAQKYNELKKAIENAYYQLEVYQDKLGAMDYEEAIMDVEDKWDNDTYDSAQEIDDAIKFLDDALQACIESDGIEPGSDLTEYIKNASFEDLSNQDNMPSGGMANAPAGWTLRLNGVVCRTIEEIKNQGIVTWCAISGGDEGMLVEYDGMVYDHQYTDGANLWGLWTEDVPDVELSQELHLVKGVYELTCDMMVQNDWSGVGITTQRLFANNSIQMWAKETDYDKNFTDDMLESKAMEELNKDEEVKYLTYAGYDNDAKDDYTRLLRHMSVVFAVGDDGKAKIGIRTNDMDKDGVAHPHTGAGWTKIDNFRLRCISLREVDVPTLYVDEDVNRDGNVNSLDVLKVYKFMQTSTGSGEGAIEDVNHDDVVNSLDVLKIYKYMQTH